MSCYLYIFVLYTVYVCIGKISSTSTHLKSNGTVESIVKSHANFNFYFLSRLFETIHGSFSTWNGLYPMWLLFVCLLIFCCCSLVCNVCPMDAWWFFFIRNRFPRIRCSKCKQIVYKSSEKKPIPNYILWQILKHYTLIHMITVLKSLLTWKNFAFSCHVHWCCIYLYLEYHSYVVAVLFFGKSKATFGH